MMRVVYTNNNSKRKGAIFSNLLFEIMGWSYCKKRVNRSKPFLKLNFLNNLYLKAFKPVTSIPVMSK
jgi:hypothetical protein